MKYIKSIATGTLVLISFLTYAQNERTTVTGGAEVAIDQRPYQGSMQVANGQSLFVGLSVSPIYVLFPLNNEEAKKIDRVLNYNLGITIGKRWESSFSNTVEIAYSNKDYNIDFTYDDPSIDEIETFEIRHLDATIKQGYVYANYLAQIGAGASFLLNKNYELSDRVPSFLSDAHLRTVSFYVQAQLGYQRDIGKQFNILLSPFFRYYVSSIDPIQMSKNPFVLGFAIEIKRYF